MRTQHKPRRAPRTASALLLLLGVNLPPQAAWSQTPASVPASASTPASASATQRETARTWWMEGQNLFKQKNYAAALERFTAAYGLVRAPTVGLWIARTQEAMGKWVEASGTAGEVINLPAAEDEPQVLRDARGRAKELRARLTPLIPALRIDVTPADVVARVEIDGEPLTVPGQKLSLKLNPGGHELLVSAPGYLTARRTVALRQQERQTLSITLVPESSAGAPNEERPSAADLFGEVSPATGTADAATTAPSALGYVALGTAGVATLVGGITGTLAFTTKPSCRDNHCRPDQRNDADASRRHGNIATIGFGVAIAAGAYGLWELLAHGSPSNTTSGPRAGARVTPLSSGALLEMSGEF